MRSQVDQDTHAELRALPPTIALWPTAADLVGVGRTKAYEMVRTKTWPTRVLRLGRRVKVPTAELLIYLGVDQPNGDGGAAA